MILLQEVKARSVSKRFASRKNGGGTKKGIKNKLCFIITYF